VHLGDAMVGRIGAPHFYERTAVGHTVNVAARLQGAASREGTRLLVSADAIAALPAPPADLESIGPLALKGFRQPVGAWKLR
jgi:adenylate cyclase